jgi:hypothetical protein
VNETILAALIGMFGLVIGALLQNYLSRTSDTRKHNRELRAKAYTDLVNSVAKLAVAAKAGASRQLDVLNDLSDAKTRIAIYGDEAVINKLSEFMAEHGVVNSEDAVKSFNKVIVEMRRDAGGSISTNTPQLISAIVFGAEDRARGQTR